MIIFKKPNILVNQPIILEFLILDSIKIYPDKTINNPIKKDDDNSNIPGAGNSVSEKIIRLPIIVKNKNTAPITISNQDKSFIFGLERFIIITYLFIYKSFSRARRKII